VLGWGILGLLMLRCPSHLSRLIHSAGVLLVGRSLIFATVRVLGVGNVEGGEFGGR